MSGAGSFLVVTAIPQEPSLPATPPSFPALLVPNPHRQSCPRLEIRLLPLIYQALTLDKSAVFENTVSGSSPSEVTFSPFAVPRWFEKWGHNSQCPGIRLKLGERQLWERTPQDLRERE